MANAPQKVLDLVETFDRNQESYLSGDFNEANLRQQFVNPLFTALGWDMDNAQGYAETYKGVIHEASVAISVSVGRALISLKGIAFCMISEADDRSEVKRPISAETLQ